MELQRGSHGMVAVVHVVRVFLVAGDKALAYALSGWSAMADKVMSGGGKGETGRLTVGGVEDWMVTRWRVAAVQLRKPCSAALPASVMKTTASSSAPTTSSPAAASALPPLLPLSPSSLGSGAQWMATKWRRVMGRTLGQPRPWLYSWSSKLQRRMAGDCAERIERHRGAWVVGTEFAWARCQGGARPWPGRDPLARSALAVGLGLANGWARRGEDEQGMADGRGPLAVTAAKGRGACG